MPAALETPAVPAKSARRGRSTSRTAPLRLPDRSRDDYQRGAWPPSPADTDSTDSMSSTSRAPLVTDHHFQDVDRGAPGDRAIFSDYKTPEQRDLARRRSQYYADTFAQREPISSPKERVARESVVMVDVRTNVIVHDEYTFITDLSYNLSTRYQRPESSILVTLTHSSCLLLGGSFEPAYAMTITALPSQVLPATNKRNAALLQRAMEDALGVPPSRGVVKFEAIAEADLAINGKTVLAEIEEMERVGVDDSKMSRHMSKSAKRQSIRSLRDRESMHHAHKSARLTPDSSDGELRPPMPPIPNHKSSSDLRAEKAQKVPRRRSFIAAVFGK